MTFLRTTRAFAMLAVVLTTLPAIARAQLLKEDMPMAAQGIEVEDRVGEFIPLNLMFKDERGTAVPLQRYFKQGKPLILTMNYSDCPGLCMAQLENLVQTLRELDGAGIGDKFEMISVSIDPTESHTKAALTKQKYVGLLAEPGAEKGWHFLTGDQKSISELAKSLGFHYFYDKASKRYSHASVTYFVSADGRICRYFLSLREEPEQFKFALNDASEGKLGASLSDTFVQMCYSYDPDANRYTADARRLLAFAGGAFVMMLLGLTAPFWFSGRKQTTATKPVADHASVQTNVADRASVQSETQDTTLNPGGISYDTKLTPDGISSETEQTDPQLTARQER